MRWFKYSLIFSIVFGLQINVAAGSIAKRDILLHIVSQCADPTTSNYCSRCILPQIEANCDGVSGCKKTSEIWALSGQYVAMRDIKMCGCPKEFIHGLTLPRNTVTGVEDTNRPEGIWQFAWDQGAKRIEPELMALVVNPKSQRSQNQLHIHMVRLDDNARKRFSRYLPVYVNDLEHVWSVAANSAASKGLTDYGVLVAKASKGQYLVITDANSPEANFTKWKCN